MKKAVVDKALEEIKANGWVEEVPPGSDQWRQTPLGAVVSEIQSFAESLEERGITGVIVEVRCDQTKPVRIFREDSRPDDDDGWGEV